jgi:glycine/D-amino acid oxidase-like deaminating enzyme
MKIHLSYWDHSSLFRDLNTAIIGSGIVGLCTAILLRRKDPSRRIVVLERGPIPYGATTRNAGFSCFGSAGELLDDLNQRPKEEVLRLMHTRISGLQGLRDMLTDRKIGYQDTGGYEIFRTTDKSYSKEIIEALPDLNRMIFESTGLKDTFSLCDAAYIKSTGFRDISGIIKNRYEGVLDSGKLMVALTELCHKLHIPILCGFQLEHIEPTNEKILLSISNLSKEIACRQVLICTNGFTGKLFPELDVKPARGQVLVTKPIKKLRFKGGFHHNKGYDYFRTINDRILIGGGRNLDFQRETTDEMEINKIIIEYLQQLLYDVILPDRVSETEYMWSGIMGVGDAKVPIIKEIQPNIYCAVRMGGMGVAIGYQVANELVRLVR